MAALVSETQVLEFLSTHQALVVRQHDDYLGVVVPDHAPEVCGGVGQGVLGHDELVAPVVTLGVQQITGQHLIPTPIAHNNNQWLSDTDRS